MKRICFFAFIFFVGSIAIAQNNVSLSYGAGAKSETEYGSPSHRATIRVESAKLCPGQEVELGIYVDLMLGQPDGGSGTYIPGQQLPPDPLDNFMFYLYISDTSKAEIVCSSTEHRSATYRVGYPILSGKMPELAGGNLTCAYIEGSPEGDLGKRGRFTCIWVRTRPSTELISTHNVPLFKIRVRSKSSDPVTISIDDPNEIAFSTGLAQLGGYYYSFYNEPGKTPNRVPGVLTAAEGPDKSSITAGPDSIICIRDRVTFNAEGGKSYRWSQCYNPNIEGGYNYEHLSNVNTKNPTFFPLHAGPYIYQVEVFDEKGCSTRDTVVYQVLQNYLETITVNPNNPMVDSGSSVSLAINGEANRGAVGRLKVVLEPDTLFSPGGNTIQADKAAHYPFNVRSLSGFLHTKPVYEPTLITATLQDTACKIQTPVSICIKGVEVTGKIAPFPVYRCGDDRAVKSLQLNLLTHGGSNKFLYNWRAVDLEFTDFPLAAPKIDNPNSRTPKIIYYGRCAVSVDIYDMETGETVTISDTMIKRDWLTASAEVGLDTAFLQTGNLDLNGPFCDGSELQYKVKTKNAGKGARYLWQVNGVWREEGVDDTVFSIALNKGDSVRCILYSTEACVATKAAESKAFSPDIRHIANPVLEITDVTDRLQNTCGMVALQADCRSVGKRFRMLWLRNNVLELDTVVLAEDADFSRVDVSFPRQSTFDGFSCMIVESDMPCGNFDTVHASVPAGNMNAGNSNSDDYDVEFAKTVFHLTGGTVVPPKAVAVEMPGSLACNTDSFTLTARVENMPEHFLLKWYRKSGEDSVLLGYYNCPTNESMPSDYSLHGRSIYGYPLAPDATDLSPVVPIAQDGFKIILNAPNASVPERRSFKAGDTVFFVLEADYYDACAEDFEIYHIVERSPYFVPSIMEPAEAPTLVVDYVEKTSLCPGTGHAYHLVASMESEADYRLDWTFMDRSVSDPEIAGYFNLSGQRNDTLESRLVIKPGIIAGTWGNCTATITEGCHAGHKQTVEFNLNDSVLNTPGFRIHHSEDTIVCANEPVQHYAQVVELSDVSATSQAEPLSQTSGSYEICWAHSLQNLISGTPEATGNTFSYTPVPNSNTPDSSGDINDNRGIFATYIKAKETSSGCEVIDSVLVMVAHRYEVKASIDYLLSDTWCDSSDYAATDPTRLVEGFPFRKGGQYALLRIQNGGDKPTIEWGLNDEVIKGYPYDTLDMAGAPDGDTLKAWVTTSMYTCLPQRVAAPSILIKSARRGHLYTHGPQQAGAGEKVLLQAYVGEHKHSIAGIDGYDFTYSRQQPDGSWQKIGEGLAGNREGWIDSLRAEMPNHSGKFRIEAQDRYKVCPAQSEDIDIALAVSTNITMKAFDPVTGLEIKGLCPQSYGFVYADGQTVPQDNKAVWVNNSREPVDVLLRTYPENTGGKAYVGYWKNGELRAMGPVGNADTLPFNPNEEGVFCTILKRGDTITAHILPGDWFGAFYVHDTVSIDGLSTHYSNQITLSAIEASGSLEITADRTAVCPGDTVRLSARFEKDASIPVTFSPEDGFVQALSNTAVSIPSRTTVYTAAGKDANTCWWKDSVRVNIVEAAGLPLSIEADSLYFCGTEAAFEIRVNPQFSRPEDFAKYFWYEVSENGDRLIDSTTEGRLPLRVKDGMRIMAQARAKLSCQTVLSQSDTLIFSGFSYPELKRLSPVLADTLVCPLSQVRISYQISPEDALVQWYAQTENSREPLPGVRENYLYQADAATLFEITARRASMPFCKVADTVRVAIETLVSEKPQIRVVANKEAVCGAEEVTYTATTKYSDYILWFANGQPVSGTGNTMLRVPRFTGMEGHADSVCAWAVRAQSACTKADTSKSEPVLLWRVEKPQLSMLCGDTTVYEGHPVLLKAQAATIDGPAPVIGWYDVNGREADTGGVFEVTYNKAGEYKYYVGAYQIDLIDVLPQCYSCDSLTITVEEFVGVEGHAPALLAVSPNPNRGAFRLQTNATALVEIFSLAGVCVWAQDEVLGSIDIRLRQPGVYFVKATGSNGATGILKVIVY